MEHGKIKGDKCNRDGCEGIVDEHPTETQCSCHINPPCSHCVDSRDYCPVCGWEGSEEQAKAQKIDSETQKRNREYYERENKKWSDLRESFYRKYNGNEGAEKLEMWSESHTHFTMIKRGVFPKGTESRASIEPKVKGTFGGRFTRFTETSFEYIADTD